ncbi:MAG: sigma-70 family RNA polymerase sigma factor [Candidatus Dormibacteraceae bacterium]
MAVISKVPEQRPLHAPGAHSGVQGLGDPDLAEAIVAGNEDALAELYDRYGVLAYSTAWRVLRDSGRAEDVVQEAFLKVWTSAKLFAASRGSMRAWLVTTVRNCAIDRLRGRARHHRAEIELKAGVPATESATDPWKRVSVSVEQTAVRQALHMLPLEQRLSVELAYFCNYTQPEIAGMMGVTVGTVKGRMRLGMHKLNSRLKGRGLLEA